MMEGPCPELHLSGLLGKALFEAAPVTMPCRSMHICAVLLCCRSLLNHASLAFADKCALLERLARMATQHVGTWQLGFSPALLNLQSCTNDASPRLPRHVMSCHAIPCPAMACRAIPCHATPRQAKACRAILCPARRALCCALLSGSCCTP